MSHPTFTFSNLREVREDIEGLSQEELAHRSGVSSKTISTAESGGRHRRKTVNKIVEALSGQGQTAIQYKSNGQS